MREIKFRAWDKEQKKMYPAEELGADQMAIMPDGRGFANISGKSLSLSQIDNGKRMIPLQYTGLRDKNGIEIYEGDIFKITVPPCESNQVVFDDGEYKLVDHGLRLSDYTPHGEVIGNIYENPELLEIQ